MGRRPWAAASESSCAACIRSVSAAGIRSVSRRWSAHQCRAYDEAAECKPQQTLMEFARRCSAKLIVPIASSARYQVALLTVKPATMRAGHREEPPPVGGCRGPPGTSAPSSAWSCTAGPPMSSTLAGGPVVDQAEPSRGRDVAGVDRLESHAAQSRTARARSRWIAEDRLDQVVELRDPR